jgi:uncharacterized protein YdeI (YjbR/CyaY-like superfamily)
MDITETFRAANRTAWRRWLDKHHTTKAEIWLLFYKKGSGQATVTYDEAVEEALCFGWIDGIVKAVDDLCYAQRFTPRKPRSKWSKPNWERVERMIAAGKMTEAGAVHIPKSRPDFEGEHKQASILPPDLMKAVRADVAALGYFKSLPPGYIRMAARWINAAKREETRARRIAEFVELCAAGKRIGPR